MRSACAETSAVLGIGCNALVIMDHTDERKKSTDLCTKINVVLLPRWSRIWPNLRQVEFLAFGANYQDTGVQKGTQHLRMFTHETAS